MHRWKGIVWDKQIFAYTLFGDVCLENWIYCNPAVKITLQESCSSSARRDGDIIILLKGYLSGFIVGQSE